MFILTLLLQTALLHSNKCLTRISDSLSQLCILQLNFQTHYVTSVSIFEAEIATDSLIISRDKLQKHSVLSSLCSHHSPQSLPQQFFFPFRLETIYITTDIYHGLLRALEYTPYSQLFVNDNVREFVIQKHAGFIVEISTLMWLD